MPPDRPRWWNRTSAEAVAASLSAALHVKVPVADAARLIRAYRSGNARAIRLAMAKYAARWKALDARTKASLIARISLTQESISADFGSLGSEATVATVASAQFPAVGQCMVLTGGFPYGLGSMGAGLDAGSSLMLTGAAGTHTLTNLERRVSGFVRRLGDGSGCSAGDVYDQRDGWKRRGAFSATVTIASHLAISNKSALATVYTTQPLTVNWTGGVAGQYAVIGGGTTHGPHTYFACTVDEGAGTFTVPSYILSSINTTAEPNGIVWISPNPLANPITIPGLDAAYFADASSDSVNVAFGVTTGVHGANTANISGSIDGLYPASGTTALLNGGKSTDGPVSFSALLTAATFTTAFDILPGASPFVVQATSAAGSAIININPAQNTWQMSYVVPTAQTRNWSFSAAGFTVIDFLTGLPLPGNIIPFSRVDPLAEAALDGLPLPNVAGPAGANGTWSTSGTLPAGGHFTIGLSSSAPQNFGGFINLTTRGAQSTSFSLTVDGQLVVSKQVAFTTD